MSRSLWLTRVGVLLLPVVSFGAFTAPASAATTGVASVSGTTVVYRAGSRLTNTVVITWSGRVITIDDRVPIKPGRGCKQVARDASKVRCTTAKTPTRVSVSLYDGNDSVVNKTGIAITAYGGSGNDVLTGGPVGDGLDGGPGNDRIYGSGGNDTIHGDAGNDSVDGGAGNDYLDGAAGGDYLQGGAGNDRIWGGDGNDRIYAGAGNDMLGGEAGDDYLDGGVGSDYLDGAAGRDHLQGGAGNDTMIGDDDPGKVFADVMLGGPGTDWVAYWYATRPVTADHDGWGGDDGQAGEHDPLGTHVANHKGGISNDHLTGNAGANWLQGSDGNDVLHGGGGNDTLYGDAGRDYLYGEGGDDFLMDVDSAHSDPVDTLDGGPNATAQGDNCRALPTDILLNCELAN